MTDWTAGNAAQPPPDVTDAFAAVYRRVMPDLPSKKPVARPAVDFYAAMSTKAADGIQAVGAFDHPEQWRFERERSYRRGEWLDQIPTMGGHTTLAPAKLEELLTAIGSVIDDGGGSFTMHYTAMVVTAARPAA